MKIIMTGASGFVGRQLVPRLAAAGCELLLLGRSRQHLQSLFPDYKVAGYDCLDDLPCSYDLLIHLAVQNNNASEDSQSFDEVNRGFYTDILTAAAKADISCVVNFSTFHTLDRRIITGYSESKRQALAIKGGDYDLKIVHLLLPPVYGDVFAGRLGVIAKLPAALRRGGFIALAALTPTVHIDKISQFILGNLAQAECDAQILLADPKLENWVFCAIKRSLDLGFAALVLLLFWWLLLIIWILVKTTSLGPGIFVQDRIGRHEKIFSCYKFRTMMVGTQQVGTHDVCAKSITGIGRILRKTKLDELPQIWNIFRGEVSLVGPRPCLPSQIELIEERRSRGVFDIAPGITGLSQIRNIDMSVSKRLATSDAEYVARQSILEDFKIILATGLGAGQGDKVRV